MRRMRYLLSFCTAAACAALMVTGDTTERAWPLLLTLGIALAVFAASWALSVRWFEAREL